MIKCTVKDLNREREYLAANTWTTNCVLKIVNSRTYFSSIDCLCVNAHSRN
jgi:hypothetical protein